jgi:hypothetical protein
LQKLPGQTSSADTGGERRKVAIPCEIGVGISPTVADVAADSYRPARAVVAVAAE